MKLVIELPALIALGQTEPVRVIQFVNAIPPDRVYSGTGVIHVTGGDVSSVASPVVDADITGPITASKIAPGTNGYVLTTTAGVAGWSPATGGGSGTTNNIVWSQGATTAGNVYGTWADVQTKLSSLVAASSGPINVWLTANGVIPAGITFDCQNLVSFRAVTNLFSTFRITVASGSYLRNVYEIDSVIFQGSPTSAEFLRMDMTGGRLSFVNNGGLELLTGSTFNAVLITGDGSFLETARYTFLNTAAPTISYFKISGAPTYIAGNFARAGLSSHTNPSRTFTAGASCYLDLYYDDETPFLGAQTGFTGTLAETKEAKYINGGTGFGFSTAGQMAYAAVKVDLANTNHVTGLGTGMATFLGTPTSANLKATVTDETGSGALVFGTSPTLTTPVISQIANTGTLTLPTATTTLTGTDTTDTLTNKGIDATTNTLTNIADASIATGANISVNKLAPSGTNTWVLTTVGGVATWAAPSGGGGGTTVNVGTGQVDFGAWPGGSLASIAITGQASILAGSNVNAWLSPADTTDHTQDEHLVEQITISAGPPSAGVGFTVYAQSKAPHSLYGKYNINWSWI